MNTKRKGQGETSSLFRPATRTLSHLKAGILGNAGSGKTVTATYLAIGLQKHAKLKTPLLYLDTEDGSDWVVDVVKAHKIDFQVAKSRAFVDLLEATEEAHRIGAILIVDSVSHFWVELLQAYAADKKAKKGTPMMNIRDWGIVKPQWARFTTAFINAKAHIIICGRAQEVFGEVDRDGHREQEVVDIRMKTEKELGYEPNLLIEMLREYDKTTKETSRIAVVRKDRNPGNDSLDGLSFRFNRRDMKAMDKKNVIFNAFLPHVAKLELTADHQGISARSSEELFAEDGEATRVAEAERQRRVKLEEIINLFGRFSPGRDKDSTKLKLDVLQAVFETTSWAAIEARSLDELSGAANKIARILERFAALPSHEKAAARLDIAGFVETIFSEIPVDDAATKETTQADLPF